MASSAPPTKSDRAQPDIVLRSPTRYQQADGSITTPASPSHPPLEWLYRTWCVTHSTLAMWRDARNVRITYKALAPSYHRSDTSSSSGQALSPPPPADGDAAPTPPKRARTWLRGKGAGGDGSDATAAEEEVPVARVDDLVEYEPNSGRGDGKLKRVEGIDTADWHHASFSAAAAAAVVGEGAAEGGEQQQQHPGTGLAWDWRGKGWLFFVTSHWEVLGWGERTVRVPAPSSSAGEGESQQFTEVTERWAVTWFAPTVFTKEGLDIYCDRPEGLSDGAFDDIMAALKGLDAKSVVELVEKDMRAVEIRLPWITETAS